MSASGNISPQSTTRIRPSTSRQKQFRPISPSPPRNTIRTGWATGKRYWTRPPVPCRLRQGPRRAHSCVGRPGGVGSDGQQTAAREQLRLASFGALDLVDPAPDDRFDRITRLAQRVLEVPLAVVSLVRDGRHWFPSETGEPAAA